MSPKSQRASAEAAARAADQALLVRRLDGLGLRDVTGVEAHENRSVLVNVTKRGVLRVHRGFAYASDRVLEAVVTFVSSDATASVRKRAEAQLIDFPVDEFVKPTRSRPRREHSRPGDRRLLSELRRRHTQFNREHFGGTLARIPIRLSGRMRTLLGELTVDPQTHRATEIAISRQHIARDGWDEVSHTLLHEMVHQWQAESGIDVDHGESFRQKAAEVGIIPGARRPVAAGASLELIDLFGAGQ